MSAQTDPPATITERYRADCQRWMSDFDPTLFVTFVFNSQITMDGAQHQLEQFHQRLDRMLVGRAALRRPEKRSVYIAAIERPTSNLHIHALFRMTDLQRVRFGLVAEEIWAELAPAGNLDIQRVTGAQGAAAYISKALRPETSDRILLPPHVERGWTTIRR